MEINIPTAVVVTVSVLPWLVIATVFLTIIRPKLWIYIIPFLWVTYLIQSVFNFVMGDLVRGWFWLLLSIIAVVGWAATPDGLRLSKTIARNRAARHAARSSNDTDTSKIEEHEHEHE